VAHHGSGADRGPTFTVFRNDLSPVQPNKARLAVAHTAAAPPADIRVDGDVLFSNVANGEFFQAPVPARRYSVDVVPTAGSGPEILAPVMLKVKAGTLTRVFAIGDVTAGTMDAVVHTIKVPVNGAAAPNRVQTGDGGQAAGSMASAAAGSASTTASAVVGGQALAVAGLFAVLVLVAAAGAGHRLARRRARA
jgi:hypothetical protein